MSDDAHSTDYAKVFAALIAALAVSLAIGHFWSTKAGIALIFAIAVAKAYLVLTEFMHLKNEPRFVKLLVVSLVLVLAVLYLGLLPDVVWVFGGKGGG